MVEVARFEDGGDAGTVAEFLKENGVPATASAQVEEYPGAAKGPIARGRVMVHDDDEAAAYALFNRVRRGEFKGDPRWAAINQLVLGGPIDAPEFRPRRLKPVALIAYGLIGLLWVVFIVMTLLARR